LRPVAEILDACAAGEVVERAEGPPQFKGHPRRACKITEALMGEQVSRSTVSRVTKTLDEKVNELRRAPVVGTISYRSSTPPSSTPGGHVPSRTSRRS
jgi:hypothetical protein